MLPKPHTPTPADRPPPPLLIAVSFSTTYVPASLPLRGPFGCNRSAAGLIGFDVLHPYIRRFVRGDFSEQTSANGSGDYPEARAAFCWGLAIRFAVSAHLTLAVLPFDRIFRIT